MHNKQYIFLLNNQGLGALLDFPAAFPLPERRVVKGRDKDTIYFKTDRKRTQDGYTAAIYTEKDFKLKIEDYADGITEPDVKSIESARVEEPQELPPSRIKRILSEDDVHSAYMSAMIMSDFAAIIRVLTSELNDKLNKKG